jgi:hypothetical protein
MPGARHVRLCVDQIRILAPVSGPRPSNAVYTRYALGWLARLPDDEVYLELIECGVRIRFYGNYGEALTLAGLRSALET